MLNRRHVRIKVMQVIYAFRGNESDDLKINQKFLRQSMENMYDLYLLILSLLVEIQTKAEDHLLKSQKKHLATSEEKNPNKKFINNELILLLKNNELLNNTLEARKISNWKLDNEYVEVFLNHL